MKKDISTDWLSLHATVDVVHTGNAWLLENLNLLMFRWFYDKNFAKKMKSAKPLEKLYTMKMMLPSLTALSNFPNQGHKFYKLKNF